MQSHNRHQFIAIGRIRNLPTEPRLPCQRNAKQQIDLQLGQELNHISLITVLFQLGAKDTVKIKKNTHSFYKQ